MIRVERYEYLYGYTAAQIDLMMYDAPVVKYKKDKDNEPKPGEKGFQRTAEQAQKAYAQWKKRWEADKAKGIKYDLGALMTNGEKKEMKP